MHDRYTIYYMYRNEEGVVAIFREIKGNEFCDILLASQDRLEKWKNISWNHKRFFVTSIVKTLPTYTHILPKTCDEST